MNTQNRPIRMNIDIIPFQTPDFVIGTMPPRLRQHGFNPDSSPKWALSEVSPETLSQMCDDYRAEIFRKAGKTDPRPLP